MKNKLLLIVFLLLLLGTVVVDLTWDRGEGVGCGFGGGVVIVERVDDANVVSESLGGTVFDWYHTRSFVWNRVGYVFGVCVVSG